MRRVHIQLISTGKSKRDHIRSVERILTKESVKITCVEWFDAFRNITAINNSDPYAPDIIQVGKTWIYHFAKTKKIANLTNLNLNLPTFIKNNDCPDYSINWFYDPILLYFRKEFVSKSSLLKKSTFLETCQKLKKELPTNHILGIVANKEWYLIHSFFSWLWGMDGDIYINPISKKLEYDEKMIDALEFYDYLISEFSNPKQQFHPLSPISFAKMEERFIRKEDFCFFIAGSWLFRALYKHHRDSWGNYFGITALPTSEKSCHPAFLGGSDLCVTNKNFKHEDKLQIEKCLKKLIAPDSQYQFCLETGHIPSNFQARSKFAIYMDNLYKTEFCDFLEKIISHYRFYPSEWEDEISISSALSEIFQNLYGGYGTHYPGSNEKRKMMLDVLLKYRIEPKYEYDVALSFAGENRDLAQKFYNKLRRKKIKVFFDKMEQSRLIGMDLDKEFRRIYGGKSRLIVILISKFYPAKDWTRFESEIIIDEAKRRGKTYFIPCIIDDTPVFGLPRTIGHIDLRKTTITDAVNMIVEKLKMI